MKPPSSRFIPQPPRTKDWDMLDVVDRVECTGFGSEADEIDAWQWLLNQGFCWQLQGMYGRNAMHLIELGMIKHPHDPAPSRWVRFTADGDELRVRLPYNLPPYETIQWIQREHPDVEGCVFLPYIVEEGAADRYALKEMESKDLTHYAPHGTVGGISVNGMICEGRPLRTSQTVDGVERVWIDGREFILGVDLKIT